MIDILGDTFADRRLEIILSDTAQAVARLRRDRVRYDVIFDATGPMAPTGCTRST